MFCLPNLIDVPAWAQTAWTLIAGSDRAEAPAGGEGQNRPPRGFLHKARVSALIVALNIITWRWMGAG